MLESPVYQCCNFHICLTALTFLSQYLHKRDRFGHFKVSCSFAVHFTTEYYSQNNLLFSGKSHNSPHATVLSHASDNT
jgi:hypothetical protein